MFSSNQILQISCTPENLRRTLDFIFKLYYGDEPNPKRQLAYQVNGPYFAIGWHIEPERGWDYRWSKRSWMSITPAFHSITVQRSTAR